MKRTKKNPKLVEAIRKIIEVGGARRSRASVIPSEWFERLEKMNLPFPEKIKWLLDYVGFTMPEGMSDAEGLRHLAELLYMYYPKDFVDGIFDMVRREVKETSKPSGGGKESARHSSVRRV